MLSYDNLVPTEIKGIDELLNGGFRPNCLCFIASKPGMGKSSLALQIAINAAKSGKKVCFFSLEMSEEQVRQKIAIQDGEDVPIIIDDSDADTDYIKKRIEEIGNIDLVIVDYLQLIWSKEKTIIESNGANAFKLKCIAKELNVPIICTTRLGRLMYGKTDDRPILQDLRVNGSIEQDTDVAILLYHEGIDLETTDLNKYKTETEIIIAKNRYGDIGTVNTVYDSEKLIFKEI